MKYCAQYLKSIKKSLKDFDEVSIKFDSQDTELVKYLQKHQTQVTNIIILDPDTFCAHKRWKLLNTIAETYPALNFKVQINQCRGARVLTPPELEIVENLKVPFFFGDRITCFEELNYFLKFSPTDVFLAEDICFDLPRAQRLCAALGTRIRAFANVAQSSLITTDALKKFFIRPEDVETYERYIDVLEFWGSEDRQATLLQIYKEGTWFGDLQSLILGLGIEIDSRYLLPSFGAVRTDCKRQCLAGSPCRVCERMLSIANTLEDRKIYIKRQKKR